MENNTVEKTTSKLQKLFEEAKSDFNLTDLNLSEKVKLVPAIKNKWIFRIASEEKRLRQLEELSEEMVEMYIEANRGQKGGEFKAKLNAEKQEEILKVKKQITIQKDCLRFLQLLLDNQVKTYTWDIKNAIEQTKLEMQ